MGWVISYANDWEDYSNYFGEGVEISRNQATAHSLVFWQCLGTVMVPLGVSFSLLIENHGLVDVDLSAILDPFDFNRFVLYLWAMSLFQKLCPAPFPPIIIGGTFKEKVAILFYIPSGNGQVVQFVNIFASIWCYQSLIIAILKICCCISLWL